MSGFFDGRIVYSENEGCLPSLERITNYKDPVTFAGQEDVRLMIYEAIAQEASDIFISVGRPISILVEGRLFALTLRKLASNEAGCILAAVCGQSAFSTIANKQPINTVYSVFDPTGGTDNTGRKKTLNFRVNASGVTHQNITSFQIVMRSIPHEPPHYSKVGLDLNFVERCCPSQGIVIVAGATGQGKSTTQASIIKEVLQGDTPIKGNIITHEEPIEFVYETVNSSHSIIVQSQIPECFPTFAAANREAMRRKPAAILIGELRDRETITSAIEASVTGHPVFATVHASSVSLIIPRILTQFSQDEQAGVLFNIIDASVILCCQRLIPKTDGRRMAVREHLYFSEKIKRELLDIQNPINVNRRIREMMMDGSSDPLSEASPTFEQQGKRLLEEGIINEDGFKLLRGN